MQSTNLPVANDGQTLDLAWLVAVIRRRLGVMVLATIILSGAIGSLIVWKSKDANVFYDGSFQVLVEPVTAEGRLAKLSLLAQSGTNIGPTELTKVGVDQADLVDYETQIRVLTSPKILNPVLKELQAKYPDISYTNLVGSLQLNRINYVKDGKEVGTKILQVQYRSDDPEQVQFVLDTLAKAYLQYSLQERLTSLRQGIQFIDEQLPELQQRVDSIQGQLQNLRERYNMNFPELTAENLAGQYDYIKRQRIDVQAQLTEAQANYENLSEAIASGNTVAILSRDPNNIYNGIINQLFNVQAQIASQTSQFREDSPPIQVLRDKEANLEQVLQQEALKAKETLAIQIRDLQARENYLARQENEFGDRLEEFPGVLRRYSDLERNVTVATDSLKAFLEKREALKLDASQREIPWELISPPDLWRNPLGVPMQSSEINLKRQLAIAIILSFLIGVGIGFVTEIIHTVYHTPDELKNGTKLPLLGAIPFSKALRKHEKQIRKLASQQYTGENPFLALPQPEQTASFREAFRSLYTNISLLGSKQRPVRSLVVGSATPDDGKSTIALELAKTAASIGQRVLLVDADLRRPQMHLRLGLSNERGLSDAIQSDLSLNDVIQQAPTQSNLFVLSGGQVSSDPIKLLSSQKIAHLMEQFQGFFDLVIYNTPPLIGLSDANLLAANSDGIILVVRLEKTDRNLATKALESLTISGASILGVVANGAKGNTANNDAIYQQHYYPPQLPQEEPLNSI
ncbi:MAG: polysaccharide biosynthesis tyrosine autokinase [Jaaginema sp. PMC 1080.18]|nr:polysaccharide biosynthesis tyrosine autokinase [Jaaginema sp. PMC 1080.18]MEC4868577.1 polysaccharide biosynthesis tyrosine autokinase [Jaaginema sp. PMC 1078.18]